MAGSTRDPALADLAEAIYHNLRALGLFVRARHHGLGFCEIVASTSPKLVTTPDGKEASGIALLLASAYDPPTLVFEEINSLQRGLGRKMVAAALEPSIGAFPRVRVNDLSPFQTDGLRWWEHVARVHAAFEWVITHDADATHTRPGS